MICEHCRKEIELKGLGMASRLSRLVCWEYGMTLKELAPGGKSMNQVTARRIVWWELVVAHDWSLPKAGLHTGGHDHTTVLHGIRREAQKKYGLPMTSTIAEIRAAWRADPDSQPLVENWNKAKPGEAA